MSYLLDPWALRHCLAAVLPFREEVPAVKTLRYYTRYVPLASFFKYKIISTGCGQSTPIYIATAVYFRERHVYFR